MNPEYLLYITLPMILGFVGQKYKDISTLKYAFFITFVFLLVYLLIYITDGGSLIPSQIEVMLITFGILFPTFLFYIQKKYRRS